jgi:hypothetical protein
MYQDFTSGADPAGLRDRIYRGVIVRFRDLAPMRRLVAFARSFVEEEFAPASPDESHEGRGEDELAQIYAAARRRFANAQEAKLHWRDVFAEAGLDPELTARDRLVLRFQPPVPPARQHHRYGVATVHLHRDSWGTNLYAQINWWAPVWPLDPGRTLAFHPHLFDRPLDNTSAGFDIADVTQRNRETPGSVRSAEVVPRPLAPLHADGVPVLIEPGEVIAFSAQHLHGGVENRTRKTRISLETRTLFIPDHVARRGAPNVDGHARWMTPGMFRRVSDGARHGRE